MRKLLFLVLVTICPLLAHSQSLKGYYYNEQYQVYLYLDVDAKDVQVPGQDIYGELPGYFGSKRDPRLWLIVECERVGENKAEIEVINDYGSEDFTASLTESPDGTLTLKHLDGSTFKIVVNSKYVKLPKEMKFVKIGK